MKVTLPCQSQKSQLARFIPIGERKTEVMLFPKGHTWLYWYICIRDIALFVNKQVNDIMTCQTHSIAESNPDCEVGNNLRFLGYFLSQRYVNNIINRMAEHDITFTNESPVVL